MVFKPQVVTTDQAAAILGISGSTVRRYVLDGKLRGFPGKVTSASIEELLGEPIQQEEATDE
jgi:predicted site-specific integrase-resolvase